MVGTRAFRCSPIRKRITREQGREYVQSERDAQNPCPGGQEKSPGLFLLSKMVRKYEQWYSIGPRSRPKADFGRRLV